MKKKSKTFNLILLFLFLTFLGLYFSSNAGVIDYQAKHKNTLTEEKIKEFENDVKNNKEIDIKKYITKTDKKYDNTVSNSTLKVSNTIGKVIEGGLKFIFGNLEKAIDNN